ncbi:pyridoxal phosphate-dependent aminotransferase [Porphyromonas loveana]|uniref:Threonine-phosphate decarboxylase n=2 Tax=Porphyromonas loveana TaxID=1884669 RepID=A0A2U1F4B5_9PORP|nr:aminotransferase class I/II-fold pyridoxal phosphate-dependent enzyme [Porphyromonas loveana]PVZ07002.1 threonine-phosphate decarboxylase [Porphyromonas loveana]
MIFGHGDEGFAASSKGIINFSTTVWSGGDMERLGAHLAENLGCIYHYPEPDAGTLRQMLAKRNGVDKSAILVTNGPTAAIYQIAQSFRGSRSLIAIPSFSEYEDACRMYEHVISFYPTTEDISKADFSHIDFCWLCTPNNPDGRQLQRAELMRLLNDHPETTFILDQSYVSFTTEEVIRPADIKNRKNLVMIHSFSHAYGIPGLRIGYIVANKDFMKRVAAFSTPWSVNALAIEAAKFILIHPAQFTLPIRKWQRNTVDFITALSRIDGVEVHPSGTTFFLLRLKKGTAAELKKYLLEEHKMLIRDASNFRGLDESYVRLTTQSPAENQLFIKALQQFLSQH